MSILNIVFCQNILPIGHYGKSCLFPAFFIAIFRLFIYKNRVFSISFDAKFRGKGIRSSTIFVSGEKMRPNGYIGRKMRLPELKEKPAIVIASFGSTRRGKAALEIFRQRLEETFPDHKKFWAYTSEIIRKKMGFSVESSLIDHGGSNYFKGLADYPEVIHFFIERLNRCMTLSRYY